MYEALDSIPSTAKREEEKTGGGGKERCSFTESLFITSEAKNPKV
jgi:hypothetical protein